MSFRKKMGSLAAVTAILIGLTGTMVSAQFFDDADDDDMAETRAKITCPSTSNIDVSAVGTFEVNLAAGENSATLNDRNFSMKLDLSCNWADQFQVDATIGAFQYQGTAGPNQASWFSGNHLTLVDGDGGNYVGPCNATVITGKCPGEPYMLGVPFAAAPDVQTTVFEGVLPIDFNVMENDELDLFILQVDYAAPGVTTATWNGKLENLPPNLANGIYKAPLTVYLTVD